MGGVCDIPAIAEVCQTVGSGVTSLVAAPFDWLAHTLAAAAAWFFEAVWAVFDTTTLVDVTGDQYTQVYNLLFGVALFVMLVFFCLQLITGLAHRDPTALSRAAVGLGKSVLGSFVAIALTATLLEITDQLAIGIVQATGNTMEGMGDRIALMAAGLVAINIASPGVGAIMTIFLAGLAIAATAIVWFSLLIRKALLLVAIVFAPIALAGFSWDATRGWFGKWVAFVVALVFSKLVLVVLFLVAINQTAAPIDLDLASISDPVAGVVLMLVAAFAPYMTYKFISFVGVDMYHAMSTEQEAKGALNRPVPCRLAPRLRSRRSRSSTEVAPRAGRRPRWRRAPPAAPPDRVPARERPGQQRRAQELQELRRPPARPPQSSSAVRWSARLPPPDPSSATPPDQQPWDMPRVPFRQTYHRHRQPRRLPGNRSHSRAHRPRPRDRSPLRAKGRQHDSEQHPAREPAAPGSVLPSVQARRDARPLPGTARDARHRTDRVHQRRVHGRRHPVRPHVTDLGDKRRACLRPRGWSEAH